MNIDPSFVDKFKRYSIGFSILGFWLLALLRPIFLNEVHFWLIATVFGCYLFSTYIHQRGHGIGAQKRGLHPKSIVMSPIMIIGHTEIPDFDEERNETKQYIIWRGLLSNVFLIVGGLIGVALYRQHDTEFYLQILSGNLEENSLKSFSFDVFCLLLIYVNIIKIIISVLPISLLDGGLFLRAFYEERGYDDDVALQMVFKTSYWLGVVIFTILGILIIGKVLGTNIPIGFFDFLLIGTLGIALFMNGVGGNLLTKFEDKDFLW